MEGQEWYDFTLTNTLAIKNQHRIKEYLRNNLNESNDTPPPPEKRITLYFKDTNLLNFVVKRIITMYCLIIW